MTTAKTVADRMIGDAFLAGETVILDLDGYIISLRSNSSALLSGLNKYFAHVVGTGNPNIEVIAVEGKADDFGFEFKDWAREPGKKGRKDAYSDLSDGRLVQKVRTGMVFLQSENHRIAYGPCLENDNQVINFINAQYMNWLQQNDALICHASGLAQDGKCLGMAGFSGGGKSTLMLRLMEKQGLGYVTNDRLFLQKNNGDLKAIGIPKLPRINPGTIVSNPTLEHLIDEDRRKDLLALPKVELWELEEKFDVDVEAVYGAGKIAPKTTLGSFLILNWQREGDSKTKVQKVDINQRPELLGAIIKSPGPFYQYSAGSFFQDTTDLPPGPYLEALKGIDIYEASGAVNFDIAASACLKILGGNFG
ncbi:MAG: HprK-related kinase B [Rhodospirillales bacterium]|nr:HprK-related kinase B [Rhodospirillales bacterium]